MPIRLYDSLTRTQRELKPAQADGIFRFYNCGPTVYAPAHIGNFRTFVVNDVIRRLLELEFGAGKVKHVRNLTDVDDKTIKRARDEGRPLAEVTKQWTDKFHADCDALNCLRPHIEPTATGHIKEQVDMIDVLMKKGNAYRAADGSVYFKVSSFDSYGKLSRVKERELQVGSALAGKSQAVDADEKEDATDFALWKAHKADDGANSWDSPWGAGRPGWHIECSAMSKKHLGDTIDLHTGGVDLLFPHHENEIAQSECCNGTTFAHHWYHSEHLLVDGKKMSKSLGNLYTLDDLKAKGYLETEVRYALLMFGHPRHQLNFTLGSLQTAREELIKLKTARDWWKKLAYANNEPPPSVPAQSIHRILDYLYDDLNTTATRSHLIAELGNNPDSASSKILALEMILNVLGLNLDSVVLPTDPHRYIKEEVTKQMTALYSGDLKSLTEVNQRIWKLGWEVVDAGSPGKWTVRSLEPERIQTKVPIPPTITALAEKRWAAKQAKDWAGADALRKELTAAGWSMLDGKDGYKLEPLKK